MLPPLFCKKMSLMNGVQYNILVKNHSEADNLVRSVQADIVVIPILFEDKPRVTTIPHATHALTSLSHADKEEI